MLTIRNHVTKYCTLGRIATKVYILPDSWSKRTADSIRSNSFTNERQAAHRHLYVIYKRTWYYGDYDRPATPCSFIIQYILKWSHKLANRALDCSARTHKLVVIIRTLHPYNCKCSIFLNARNKK